MKLPQRLVQRLSPFVEMVRGEPLVEPFLALTEPAEQTLLLTSCQGRFAFDLARREMTPETGEPIAFSTVQSIDVAALPGGRGQPSWSLTLYRGPIDRTLLGRSYDDGDASVVAARLARAVGCKVVALTLRR